MVIQGIIRPPPDIRAVVDKTSLFVSKNGRAFESRILNSDKGKTTKFAFLHDNSPFHAYYEDRIRFYESGDAAAEKNGLGDDDKGRAKEADEGQNEKSRSTSDVSQGKATEIVPSLQANDAPDNKAKDPNAVHVMASKLKSRIQRDTIDPVSRALLSERGTLNRAMNSEIEDTKTEVDNFTEVANSSSAATKASQKKGDAATTLAYLEPTMPIFVHMAAPSNATPEQLDVMRVTAQYAALSRIASSSFSSSTSFLDELTMREWNDPLFGFLQPRHGHFAYFAALVDGYRKIIYLVVKTSTSNAHLLDVVQLKKKEMDDVDKLLDEHTLCRNEFGIGDLSGSLRAASHRAEYNRMKRQVAEKRRQEEDGDDTNRIGGSALIDWHDFVVVETVDFAVDEVVEAPPPPIPKPKVNAVGPPLTKEVQTKEFSAFDGEKDRIDMDGAEDDKDVDDENIQIVSDYKPKVVSHTSTANDLTRTHMIDPITGKSIALTDMSEHMRIQLLDPKWAEERKRFMARQAESNFVQGDDIAKNISRFAKQRGDIFGSSREELLNQEEDSKKRLEEANRIIREQAALSQSQQQLQSQSTSTLGTKRPATELAEQPGLHQSHLSHHSQRPEPHVASDFKKIRTEESLPGKEFKSAVHSSDAPMPPPPPILPNSPPKQVKATPPMTEQEFLSTQTQDQVSTTSFSAQDEPHMADAGTSDQSAEPKRPVTISGPVTLHIQVPGAGPDDHMFLQWNFKGQIIALSIDDAESTSIKSIKDQLSRMLGNMPLNKMQLKNDHIGFLKDNYKLSDSVGSTVENIDLVPKVRGGRK